MADRDRPLPQQLQVHPLPRYDAGGKLLVPQRGPSPSKVLAVLAMLPVGGTLLALAGVTLTGTIIGLCVTTPLFIIFSPVIVPAAIVIGLAVTGFFTSGAFGLTALSSLSWVLTNLRQKAGMVGYVGQNTKEVGQEILQIKAHDTGKTGRT